MEKDDEVYGIGNSLTTEFRQYSPRLARWLSIDPVMSYDESPYVAFRNSPIVYSDPNGDCPDCPMGKDVKAGDVYVSDNSAPGMTLNNQMYSGTDGAWFGYEKVSKQVYVNIAGENAQAPVWRVFGFEFEDGESYVWDMEKEWYVDCNGKEYDDWAIMDITNGVGSTVAPFTQMMVDGINTGDYLKSLKEAYHAHGGSISEFVYDGIKEFGSSLVDGGHKGTVARWSVLAGFNSGGGTLGTGVISQTLYKSLAKLAKTGNGGFAAMILIQFGKTENQVYHAFRHIDAMGLDRSLVKTTISKHFKTVASEVEPGKPFNQIIEINGKKVQYTAFKLEDGTFNIGRIHGVE